MFGHGSSRCMVKTFCANCAGNNKPVDCKESIVKCANCKGPHKAMSHDCPNRETFLKIRQRAQPKSIGQRNQQINNRSNYNVNFPNVLNQSETPNTSIIGNSLPYSQNFNNNNNLFSFEELKNLTFDLISNLRKCKTREEQFQVVTNLACKFLYQ